MQRTQESLPETSTGQTWPPLKTSLNREHPGGWAAAIDDHADRSDRRPRCVVGCWSTYRTGKSQGYATTSAQGSGTHSSTTPGRKNGAGSPVNKTHPRSFARPRACDPNSHLGRSQTMIVDDRWLVTPRRGSLREERVRGHDPVRYRPCHDTRAHSSRGQGTSDVTPSSGHLGRRRRTRT
jgi:hypothetical protein